MKETLALVSPREAFRQAFSDYCHVHHGWTSFSAVAWLHFKSHYRGDQCHFTYTCKRLFDSFQSVPDGLQLLIFNVSALHKIISSSLVDFLFRLYDLIATFILFFNFYLMVSILMQMTQIAIFPSHNMCLSNLEPKIAAIKMNILK